MFIMWGPACDGEINLRLIWTLDKLGAGFCCTHMFSCGVNLLFDQEQTLAGVWLNRGVRYATTGRGFHKTV